MLFIYLFLIDKKEDILKRAAKKAAQGIQKVYSYHQPPPQKHQDAKKKYNQPTLTNGPTNLESKKELKEHHLSTPSPPTKDKK